MIGMRIDKAKGLFFDTKAVERATTRAERKWMGRFGGEVRKRSRQSMKKPPKSARKIFEQAVAEENPFKKRDLFAKYHKASSSRPGSPPFRHTDLLRKTILYVYDPARRSVVIGPVRLNGKPGTAPAALEHGGAAVIGRRGKRRRVTVAKRPFMQPAYDVVLQQLPRFITEASK